MDQEEMEVCSGARRSEERGTCGEDVLYERKIYFQLEKKERKLLCAFTLQMHIYVYLCGILSLFLLLL